MEPMGQSPATISRETFQKNFTVWTVSVSSWQGRDKLSANDLDKSPSEIPDIFKLGSKSLIPDDVRRRLISPRAKINALMQAANAHPFFVKSLWAVPDQNFLFVKNGIERIQQEQAAIVEDVVQELYYVQPTLKDRMIEKYPQLADAKWPNEYEIKNEFSITPHCFQVAGLEFNQADPEEVLQAKQESKERLEAGYRELEDLILQEAHMELVETCQKITEKVLDNVDKVTETTLKKPKRVIERYTMMAGVFDNQAIKDEVEKLRLVVESVDAKTIRDHDVVASQFAARIREIGESIGDLAGIGKSGMVKRVVKMGAPQVGQAENGEMKEAA